MSLSDVVADVVGHGRSMQPFAFIRSMKVEKNQLRKVAFSQSDIHIVRENITPSHQFKNNIFL